MTANTLIGLGIIYSALVFGLGLYVGAFLAAGSYGKNGDDSDQAGV